MSTVFPPGTPPLSLPPIREPLDIRNDGKLYIADNLPWSTYFELQNAAAQHFSASALLLTGLESDRPAASQYPDATRYYATDTTNEYEVSGGAWIQVHPLLSGTHATRIALDPSVYPVGTQFIETDRHYLYSVQIVAAVHAWVWIAGVYIALIANRPADLAANDAGAL